MWVGVCFRAIYSDTAGDYTCLARFFLLYNFFFVEFEKRIYRRIAAGGTSAEIFRRGSSENRDERFIKRVMKAWAGLIGNQFLFEVDCFSFCTN